MASGLHLGFRVRFMFRLETLDWDLWLRFRLGLGFGLGLGLRSQFGFRLSLALALGLGIGLRLRIILDSFEQSLFCLFCLSNISALFGFILFYH